MSKTVDEKRKKWWKQQQRKLKYKLYKKKKKKKVLKKEEISQETEARSHQQPEQIEQQVIIEKKPYDFDKIPILELRKKRKRKRLNYQQRLANEPHQSWVTAYENRIQQQALITNNLRTHMYKESITQ